MTTKKISNTKIKLDTETEQSKPVRKRFYAIMLLLPIIILVGFEWGLRITGFGHSYALFIPAMGAEGYLQPNPELIKRYFHQPELAPNVSPDTLLFKQSKSNDSFRIVVMGGSTAAGFPFGRFGSMTGQLQTRFKRLYPDKNIEVISTAMASVNTYTLLDITPEIIEIKPDLVVVYAGHNEYLGVMGVGSVYAGKGSRAANLLFLKVKEWRLFQLVEWAYYALIGPSPSALDSASNSHTLMAKVAENKNISLDSPLFKAGIEQFEQNLALILAQFEQAKVPVLIGTLAANEAQQKPFVSAPVLDFSDINKTLQTDIELAKNQLKALIVQYPYSADPEFKLATLYQSQANIPQALQHFIQASDKDLLRFRAPSIFNAIIRQQAKAFNANIVDSQDFLRQHNNGLIDNSIMYEHLHPNKLGYFLLTEAFVEQIINAKLIASQPELVSEKQAWLDVPLTDVDIINADFKIRNLLADYPFSASPQKVEFGPITSAEQQLTISWIKGKPWLEVQQALLSTYQQNKDLPQAAKVAGILFDALPQKADIAQIASKLYRDNQDFTLAYYYARKAHELESQNISYLLTLAQMQYQTKRLDKAISSLEQVLGLSPAHKEAQYYLQQLTALKNRHDSE
jgi:tetratricopeptide (TPR) repeat protein